MTRILFVCHGNICRSPMAEFVMKDITAKAGLSDEFLIESAATSTEEIGNPVYLPARRKLSEHGIVCDGKTARQVRRADYDKFDLIIGMDEENMCNLRRLHRKTRQRRRPVVHTQLRGNMAGCPRRLHRPA